MTSAILFFVFLVVVLWLIEGSTKGWLYATVYITFMFVMMAVCGVVIYFLSFTSEPVRIGMVSALFVLLFLYLLLNKPVKNYFSKQREIETLLCNIWVQTWVWNGAMSRWEASFVTTLWAWLKKRNLSLSSISYEDLTKYSGLMWVAWDDEKDELPAPAEKQNKLKMDALYEKDKIGKYYND